MGAEHELDVLEARSFLTQPGAERRESLLVRRAGVNEREGLPTQQPRIHRPDVSERERDG